MEAIILQISATLVKGKARISWSGNKVGLDVWFLVYFTNILYISILKSQYSLTRAQQSFKSLVQIHEKSGEKSIDVLIK